MNLQSRDNARDRVSVRVSTPVIDLDAVLWWILRGHVYHSSSRRNISGLE